MKRKMFEKSNYKKLLTTALITGVLGTGLAVEAYLILPSNELTIDVNPSIELQTNRLNQVVEVNPLNEDATAMLQGFEIKDNDLEKVVEDLVDRMVLTGYISGGSDNLVMVSVDENNHNKGIVDEVNQAITAYLENRQLEAAVLSQSVDANKEDVKLADEKDVSPGKLSLIQKIIAGDKSLSLDDLASISFKELVLTAEENNIDTTQLFDHYSTALDESVKYDHDDKEQKNNETKVPVQNKQHDVAQNDRTVKVKAPENTKETSARSQKSHDDRDDKRDDDDHTVKVKATENAKETSAKPQKAYDDRDNDYDDRDDDWDDEDYKDRDDDRDDDREENDDENHHDNHDDDQDDDHEDDDNEWDD